MRALITGASGFVGRTLTAHLLNLGDEAITDGRDSGGPDVTDREATHEFVSSANADVIYHLAAQAHVPTSWHDPIGTLRTNVEGTQNVLDAAHAAGSARVVLVSSAEVYGSVGHDQLPIDENAPLRPISPYAASKAAADIIGLQSHLGRGQDVIRLRAFNHFGPGQRTDFVTAGLAHRIAVARRDGLRAIDVGSLDVRRDFTDVRDIVQAYRHAAIDGEAGGVYNVCSGIDRSIREIAEGLLAAADCNFELISSTDLQRKVDSPIVRGSFEKIRAHTGWHPTITLTESLADIVDDAQERLDAAES